MIELLVVFAIIAILIGSVFTVRNRVETYRIESDARSIHGLLQRYRAVAFSEKREFYVRFDDCTGSAVSSGSELCICEVGTGNTEKCIELYRQWNWKDASSEITISDRGTATQNSLYYDSEAKLDCVAVSLTRVRLGKWDGNDTCEVR